MTEDELIRRLKKVYAEAIDDLTRKIEKYLAQFEEEDAEMRALYDSGEMTHAEYMAWRYQKLAGTKQWEDMRKQLTFDLVHADQIAADMINDALPAMYAEGHNYGTYEAEIGSGWDTTYTLYDRDTVERLLEDDPELLPAPSVNIPKDQLWNRQHIQSAMMQGILQGESMKDIAKRFQNVVGMDERAAIRNARTAVTGAENAGRIDSYKRAEAMGIDMKQMWMATLDGRTRDSHAAMDGEQQNVGKKFSNGCRYPGDPQGPASEIYNCRCTLVAVVEGADPYNPNLRKSAYLEDEGLTYDEWKQMHVDRYNSKLFKDYDGEKPKIVFADKFNDEKWSETKRIINLLSSEYNTRLAEVVIGAEKGAGDTDITGHRIRLNSKKIEIAFHEFSHTLANTKADKYGLTNDSDFWKEIKKIRRTYRNDVGQDTTRWISSYEHSSKDIDEFMAEAFTLAKMFEMGYEIPDIYGKDLMYANQVLEVVNKYFRRKRN